MGRAIGFKSTEKYKIIRRYMCNLLGKPDYADKIKNGVSFKWYMESINHLISKRIINIKEYIEKQIPEEFNAEVKARLNLNVISRGSRLRGPGPNVVRILFRDGGNEMKFKSDFITNSSSTSFILADCRKDKNKPIEIEVFMDRNCKITIFDLNKCFNIHTISDENLKKEILGEFEDPDKFDQYMFEEIKLLKFQVSDEDGDLMQTILCDTGIGQEDIKTEDVIVISGEGGY